MASIIFKIRGKSSLYFRLRNGRYLDATLKLPFIINANDWSATKQKFKNNLYVNNELNKFKAFLLNAVNIAKSNQEILDLNWIKDKQFGYFNPDYKPNQTITELKEYIQYYIDTVCPKYNKFFILKKKIQSIEITKIDTKYLERFTNNSLAFGYSENYTAKLLQLIKQVLRHAERNGYIVKREVFEFRTPAIKTLNTYLNDDEINLVFSQKFNNERLENVKRLFLIGCTTGLRVSDLMRIKHHTFNNGFMELQSIKTKQPLIIPIDPRVKEFIPNIRIISDVKFNKYLKELCQIVGIDDPTKGYVRDKQNKRVLGVYPKYKLITSHTMRRSFATNLYGKVPTVVIMAITGHTTEKSFLTYIKKPQRDFAEQLKQYYLENY